MSGDLQIVAVSGENLDELLDLMEDYQRFYKVEDIDRDRNRRFFSRLLDRPEESLQFIACRDGRAVGFITLYFPYSSTRAATYALMNDLFVSQGARGEGIGRALIVKARDIAYARGFAKLTWMTAQDNQAARHLYDEFEGVSKSAWLEYELPTGLEQ